MNKTMSVTKGKYFCNEAFLRSQMCHEKIDSTRMRQSAQPGYLMIRGYPTRLHSTEPQWHSTQEEGN